MPLAPPLLSRLSHEGRDRYFVDDVECMIQGRRHRVANLGLGGFFAETDRPPLCGTILLVELQFPSQRRCRVVGQVAWINDARTPASDTLPAGFGASVTWVEPYDRAHVLRVLNNSAPMLSLAQVDPGHE